MIKALIFLTASLLLLFSCTSLKNIPTDQQQAFLFGIEQNQKGNYPLSISATWHYLRESNEQDPKYDRTLRLMARNAQALGLNYLSAQWYLEIAKGRRDPTLIPEAIEGIEKNVLSGIYDEDTLINHFIALDEISALPTELNAFVSYHQGIQHLKQGLDQWAQQKFNSIHPTSMYAHKASYVLAIDLLRRGQIDEAEKRLEVLKKELVHPLVEAKMIDKELKKNILLSLARLAIEKKNDAKALLYFEEIRQSFKDQPELLLEIAWVHFRQSNPRKTLGYLFALEAPIYRDLITPEKFILEALALQSLCQFGPARQAAIALGQKYKQALDDLSLGIPPEQSLALRAAAAQRSSIRAMSRLLDSLDTELKVLHGLQKQLDEGLYTHLKQLYEQAKVSMRTRREGRLREEIEGVAQELLLAQESVALILHELGVALLRGRKAPAQRGSIPELNQGFEAGQVAFPFDTEFWTDELDDIIVLVEDRCIDESY
jgi:hypothetical protein